MVRAAVCFTYAPSAYVWLGGISKEAPELEGYGVLPHPELKTQLAEVIFCSNVFPNRTMPGRFLIRVETAIDELPDGDTALLEQVEAEVRRWTKTQAAFGFHKVHRFSTPKHHGTQAECLTRLREIAAEISGLSLA